MATRHISFAGRTAAVDYRGAAARDLLEFLYRDIPPDLDAAPPHIRLRLESSAGGGVELWIGSSCLKRDDCGGGQVADALLSETLFHLADWADQGMVFHSAALARGGKGLLLPGYSGAGKSTLTAWLVQRKFNYLTDELVYVPRGSMRAQAFTRPINIKHPAMPVLYRLAPALESQRSRFVETPVATLVPHRLLNRRHRRETPLITTALFPEYRAGSSFEMRLLTPAETAMALMGCLINARNLENNGFTEAIRVARGIRAYRMVYGGFEQLDERFFDVLP